MKLVRVVVKADAKPGVMLSLSIPLDVAKQIALDGGEDPAAMHCTLAYMGRADDLPADAKDRALAAARVVAAKFGPVVGVLGGIGRFNASATSDGKDVLHAMLDAPLLPALRHALVEALDEARLPPKREHGYSPHVTLRYEDAVEGAAMPRIPTTPVVFQSLTLSIGDDRVDIPLAEARITKSAFITNPWGGEFIGEATELERRDPTTIQSLIFAKDAFDRDASIAWIEAHDFTHDKPIDETADSWRFRQREPGDFEEGSLRTITLRPGVQAVIGRLPATAKATELEKRRERRSASYLDAVLDTARKQLPDWLWRQVHAAAFPSAGGRARRDALGAVKLSLNLAKSASRRLACSVDEKQLIYAIAMEPDEIDAHGEATTAAEIEAACHAFLAGQRAVNVEHKGPDVGAEIVESYIAPADMQFGEPPQPIRRGTWPVVIHVSDPALWARAKAGDFGGISVEGLAVRTPG